MKRIQLEKFAASIAANNLFTLSRELRAALSASRERFADTGNGRDWIKYGNKFALFVATIQRDGDAKNVELPFSVFAENGNVKEPFLSFASLPGIGFCHGAGECLTFCYSFRAWRYPAAFFRQAMNSILMQSATGRERIAAELSRILATRKNAKRDAVEFRLYTDGDFSSAIEVNFWMSTIAKNPKLAAYGYSKAWRELLAHNDAGFNWPANYQLNISSGSNHTDATREKIRALPITRGEFIAVSIGQKVKSADHGTTAHNKVLRAAYGKKAFTCPGSCGDCTPTGHACGSEKFAGIDIIIAVH